MNQPPDAVPVCEVGPAGTIRFAVGALDKPRSTSWRIWSAKRTPDVYLAIRKTTGVKKISFHKSGSWSDSFINSERIVSQLPAGTPRHMDIWAKPDPLGDGWRRGYSIVVPWTELRTWPAPEPGKVNFIPPPPPGYWAFIEIIFAEPDTSSRLIIEQPMFALGSMTLADDSQVKIAARLIRPSPQDSQNLAKFRDQALKGAAPALADIPSTGNMRMALSGVFGDGTRCMFDLALYPPPPGEAVICTYQDDEQIGNPVS